MNIEKIKIKRKEKWVPASIHQEVITELKGDNINPNVTWGRKYHHTLQELSVL